MKSKTDTKQKKRRGNPMIAQFGERTRFRKGVSGNPGGRPSWTPYADAHREVAQLAVRDLKVTQNDPVSLAVAKRVARAAIAGKISAASEAASRCEGTPRQMVELAQQREVTLHVVYTKAQTLNKIRQFYGLSGTDAEAAETTPIERPEG